MRLWLSALLWLVLGTLAVAQDKVQLQATAEQGYGRLVLEFNGRLDLPKYKIVYDNNVLSITFDDTVTMAMPDMAMPAAML